MLVFTTGALVSATETVLDEEILADVLVRQNMFKTLSRRGFVKRIMVQVEPNPWKFRIRIRMYEDSETTHFRISTSIWNMLTIKRQ